MKLTQSTLQISLLALFFLLAIGIDQLYAAWSAPANNPPTCNAGDPGCDAPITTSATNQVKDGALTVGTFSASNTRAMVVYGALATKGWAAIGTDNVMNTTQAPQQLLHLRGKPGVDGIKFPDDSVQVKAANFSFDDYLHVQHRTTVNSSIGGGWTVRPLTHVISNTMSGASLSSDRISLPAGRYYVQAETSVYSTQRAKLALFNETSGQYILHGLNTKPNGNNEDEGGVINTVSGVATLNTPSEVTIRLYAGESGACLISGVAPDVCSDVKIWKLD